MNQGCGHGHSPGGGDRMSVALAVIPARLGSTRLPRKMLADIGGQPLVVRTAQAVAAAGAVTRVVVATDCEEIAAPVRAAGFTAVMTPPQLPSGTDRVAAAVATIADPQVGVVLNVQGDEPLLDGESLRRLVAAFGEPRVEMATLALPLAADDAANPNAVKVVVDANDDALYFSRSLIPYPRHSVGLAAWRHVGVYAWRPAVLQHLTRLPPCLLERTESLEQLRALFNGIRIRVVAAAGPMIGVDTEADLERVRRQWAGARGPA